MSSSEGGQVVRKHRSKGKGKVVSCYAMPCNPGSIAVPPKIHESKWYRENRSKSMGR